MSDSEKKIFFNGASVGVWICTGVVLGKAFFVDTSLRTGDEMKSDLLRSEFSQKAIDQAVILTSEKRRNDGIDTVSVVEKNKVQNVADLCEVLKQAATDDKETYWAVGKDSDNKQVVTLRVDGSDRKHCRYFSPQMP